MSLVRSALKLNAFKPAVLASRQVANGWNHVVMGPPTVRMPFWKKMCFMGSFTVFMFTYPFYVTYMMHEWDLMDNNL